MTAILPTLKIDSDAQMSRYFTKYQVRWILDDSRMRLAEKTVRCGWTFGDAFKNVRKRLHHPNRDYLFATKDYPSAIEYIASCKKFCEIYNFTKSILSHGEDLLSVPVLDRDGKPTGFTEEIKIGYIKFDNGARIIAFSSDPRAMQVFGGDVGLDEFAKGQGNNYAQTLWETAQGRITWGYDIGVWSSHNGTDTLFYAFAKEAAAGQRGWSYYRVTMEDAIDMGLLDKINAASGKNWTKEEFIQDCKDRAGSSEIYEQSYNCNPSGSTSAIVAWSKIELCSRDYSDYERIHLENQQLKQIFGEFNDGYAEPRRNHIGSWLGGIFGKHRDRTANHSLGFDVAASGQGDLASIYVDQNEASTQRLRALFTCRTEDWDFLKTTLFWFLRNTTSLSAIGDETGLGRQICWEAAQKFSGLFTSVNFKGTKHDMGFALMNQLDITAKQWPAKEKDIATDFFALRKFSHNGKMVFSEGVNNLNKYSHCDIAWAGAMSTRASTQAKSNYGAVLI
jgi:phage FluMu gp28-like protein